MKLTWKEIKTIVNLADKFIEEIPPKELLKMGEEKYYNLILDTFKTLSNEDTDI